MMAEGVVMMAEGVVMMAGKIIKTTRFLSKIDVFQNKSLKNKIDKNCLRGSVTGGKG